MADQTSQTPVSQLNLPLFDNPPAELRVRAAFCEDAKGKLQVVASANSIIDPAAIAESTSRTTRNMVEDIESIVSAIPGVYGLPSVVEADLVQQPVLALATDQADQYVKVTGAQLDQMCHSHASFQAQFSSQLISTPADPARDHDDILAAVDEFTSRRIQARLDETLHIPPLPDSARRILELQRDPNADLADLVAVIETDPAIAARIIGWANSAFYSAPNAVKTLNDAIMRVLGFDVVFNMALGLAIGQTLKLPADQVRGHNPYWLDAVFTAASMEGLASRMPATARPNPGTCYLTGLLHNFGTLVVGHVFVPQYQSICRLTELNPGIHHTHIDQHVLHLNREVIASTLLELWDLPEEVTTALRFQHVKDYQGEHAAYLQTLRLSRRLLTEAVADEDGELAPLSEATLALAGSLHLEGDTLREVATTVAEANAELADLARHLG